MVFKATIAQTVLLLKKKESICVFYVLFFMVMMNFIGNVLYFQGSDVLEMYQPMKLLLLSYNRTNFNGTNTLSLIQLYPLLVVCPAGFSLAREYQLGMRVFLVSRMGNFKYHVSKYLSVFLTTMIIFTIPFLMEIFLNYVSFPQAATGDFWNESIYDISYRNKINNYFMKSLYLYSPCLYAIAGTLMFGAVSGLLGVFTAAISSLIKVKYRVFLFLPVFVVLNLSALWANGLAREMPSLKWYDYILIFNDELKMPSLLFAGMAVLVLFAIATVRASKRKDCL